MTATATAPCRRGTSNSNQRGSSEDRRRRREWLVRTYRANVNAWVYESDGEVVAVTEPEAIFWSAVIDDRPFSIREDVPACRCYRCGRLLTVETVTADRIIPGCEGGTYCRNNIRPACGICNSVTGGALASRPKKRRRKK